MRKAVRVERSTALAPVSPTGPRTVWITPDSCRVSSMAIFSELIIRSLTPSSSISVTSTAEPTPAVKSNPLSFIEACADSVTVLSMGPKNASAAPALNRLSSPDPGAPIRRSSCPSELMSPTDTVAPHRSSCVAPAMATSYSFAILRMSWSDCAAISLVIRTTAINPMVTDVARTAHGGRRNLDKFAVFCI